MNEAIKTTELGSLKKQNKEALLIGITSYHVGNSSSLSIPIIEVKRKWNTKQSICFKHTYQLIFLALLLPKIEHQSVWLNIVTLQQDLVIKIQYFS